MQHLIPFINTLLLILALVIAQPTRAQTPGQVRALEGWIPIVNEFTDRRRNNTLFINRQAPNHGFQVSYVHTARGNLTFARRDLVRLGDIPLVAARVYDSHSPPGDFGPGWRLSWSEQIVQETENRWHYTDETGSVHQIDFSTQPLSISSDLRLRVLSVRPLAGGALEFQLRDGWMKLFRPLDDRWVLAEIRDENGRAARFDYGASGLLESVSGRDGSPGILIHRQADGRIVKLEDDLGRTVKFRYDSDGLLEASTDLSGSAWRYAYDEKQMLVKLIDPAGSEALSVQYGSSGNVAEIASRGRTSSFAYLGLQTRVDSATSFAVFHHDTAGYVTAGHASNANAFRVTRNRAGQATSAELARGFADSELALERTAPGEQPVALSWSVGYDLNGRMTSLSKFGPGSTDTSMEIRYDENTIQFESTRGDEGFFRRTASGFELSGFDVDRGAHFLRRDFIAGITESAGQTGSWRIIQAARGPIKRVSRDGVALMDMNYRPDQHLAELRIGKDTARYDYDAAGLRRGSTWSNGFSQSFDYDPAGNLSKSDSQIGRWRRHLNLALDDQNKVTALSMNGVSVSTSYDARGNLVGLAGKGLGAVEFGFDAGNRFDSVIRDGARVAGYQYLPFERDLRAVADDRTGRIVVRSARAQHTYGSYEEVFLFRNDEAWEWLHYDESAQSIRMADVLTAADGQKRIDALLSRLSLSADAEIVAASFDKPSSPLFLPPEWNAINCTICEVEPQIGVPGFASKGPNDPPFNGCFPTINTVSTPKSRTETGAGIATVANGVGEPPTIIPYNERVTEDYVVTSVFANQELVLEQLSLGETTFLVFGNLPNTPHISGLSLYDASHEYQGDGGSRLRTSLSLQHIGGETGRSFSALSTGHVVAVRERPHLATSTTDLMAFPTHAGLAVADLRFNSITVGL